jgi:nucleotide-binding universal stress UspA family protein
VENGLSSLNPDGRTGPGERGPRIVVGVDGSPDSLRALDWAAKEARIRTAALEVVHVGTFRRAAMELFSPNLRQQEESLLDAAVERAKQLEPGIEVRGRLCEPPVTEALIEASDGAEMLVVGSRGLTGLRELAIGSTSSGCAHHARCPVLIVRPMDTDEHPIDRSAETTEAGQAVSPPG